MNYIFIFAVNKHFGFTGQKDLLKMMSIKGLSQLDFSTSSLSFDYSHCPCHALIWVVALYRSS